MIKIRRSGKECDQNDELHSCGPVTLIKYVKLSLLRPREFYACVSGTDDCLWCCDGNDGHVNGNAFSKSCLCRSSNNMLHSINNVFLMVARP